VATWAEEKEKENFISSCAGLHEWRLAVVWQCFSGRITREGSDRKGNF
jgi:hypothetical protein